MKNLKLILVVLVSVSLLTSCTKAEYDDRYWEQISIDPENTDTYQWLNIADGMYQNYQTRENGDKYTFKVDGNVVSLTSSDQMTEVRLIKQVVGKGYINLPIVGKTVTQEDVHPDYAFRIYYQ